MTKLMRLAVSTAMVGALTVLPSCSKNDDMKSPPKREQKQDEGKGMTDPKGKTPEKGDNPQKPDNPKAENKAPIVEIKVGFASTVIKGTKELMFEAQATDPDGDAITYKWMLDGKDAGVTEKTYRLDGTNLGDGKHKVSVEVQDARGGKAQAEHSFEVMAPDFDRAIWGERLEDVKARVSKKGTASEVRDGKDGEKILIYSVDGNKAIFYKFRADRLTSGEERFTYRPLPNNQKELETVGAFYISVLERLNAIGNIKILSGFIPALNNKKLLGQMLMSGREFAYSSEGSRTKVQYEWQAKDNVAYYLLTYETKLTFTK